MNNLPNGIMVHADIRMDWRDRFRVLLGRTIHYHAGILTEHDPGVTKVDFQRTYVDSVFPSKPLAAGVR